jgi:hypothetical protein
MPWLMAICLQILWQTGCHQPSPDSQIGNRHTTCSKFIKNNYDETHF